MSQRLSQFSKTKKSDEVEMNQTALRTQTLSAAQQCVRERVHDGRECTGRERESIAAAEPVSWPYEPEG